MVNKRLIETAKKWMNKNLPPEKKQPKKQENLEKSKLEKDSKEKPKLTLNKLEKTVVNTPTQEKYNTLMQVYECGGWEWVGGELPTKSNLWGMYKEETCIGAENMFTYCSKEYYRERRYKIISPQEFYNAQKPPITPEMLDEINKWFEKNGK